MASCSPGSPYLFVEEKERAGPCVIYSMRMSIKKAEAFWSHRSSRRFFPERRGSFPILICRVVGPDDHIEPVMLAQSGAPGGEPPRPGVISGNFEERYYYIQLYRENGMLHKDGSPAPWKEVAVIRGMPGGRGITVTSHVKRLALRLHDFLFMLCGISATVDLRFSEKWFRLPAGWTEERLYAEDGSHIVDIGASVENLVKKLWDLRDEEEQEMEKRKSETEEEKERRLQEEEAMHMKEEEMMREREEEWKKMRKREEEERRRESAVARMTPTYPPVWDVVLGKTGRTLPAVVSMFNLTMNSKNQVVCKCIKEEGLQDMLRRALNCDYILPISKTTPPSASTLSGSSLEVLGYVESYCLLGYYRFGENCRFMDESGRMLSPVMMLSQSVKKVLTIIFLVDKFNILLDDGLTISGYFESSVDIHCDDISCSELLTADWRHHFLCQNIDGEVTIPFSTLLVQLKKKLQLQLTDEELDLYASSVIHAEVENEKFVPHQQQSESELLPTKPKHELAEVALNDYSLLFPNPW
ncbi:hypothetical protein HU200_035585 [Digitaria exilis]|uniref:Uncharacterized protein n=1 Tax=Digitaria exilis TaxID=1010633 RepID=A0A835EN05_9POAL|nr:hypothetical protein HU200_035585 [Digitaria exilis]